MPQLTAMMMMTSNLSKTGAAFLLVSLGVASPTACGGSDGTSSADDGGSSTDGGKTADGGNAADGGKKSDGGDNPDSGKPADAGSKWDGGSNPSPAAVNLGTAGNFVVLAMSGISSVPNSIITGDLGVSPAAASYITGFSLIADSTNTFATSTQVTGKVYASDYTLPTPSNLTTAISDMQTAFTDAAGRSPDATEMGAGDISGMTIGRGVYKWSTGLLITSDVTLKGSATDVWIFEIAQDLTMASGTKIVLTGGAVPNNVFWQFSGAVTLGTTAHIEGVILAQTSIALQTGASIKGRLLAQSAVTIDTSTISAL